MLVLKGLVGLEELPHTPNPEAKGGGGEEQPQDRGQGQWPGPMEEARQGLLGKARRKRGVRYRGAHKSRGQGRWGTERFLSQG